MPDISPKESIIRVPDARIISSACLIVLIAISAVKYPASYWMGYREESYSVLSDPIIMGAPWILIAAILVITWMSSLIRRKFRRWTTAMVIGMAILVVADQFAPHTRTLMVYGLRDRVMRDYGLEGLRHFAHDVDTTGILHGGQWINHGYTSDLTGSDRFSYEQLRKKYAFLTWNKNSTSLLNYQDDSVVDFEWGGALFGHWGCSIAVDGKKNDSKIEDGVIVVPVSDDIYFYLSPD